MERNYHESDFQTDFGTWARHCHKYTAGFELKVDRITTGRIYFNQFEPHQLPSLKATKHSVLYHKISDADMNARKPYDCFMIVGGQAFVVLMFRHKERGQREFLMIDIDDFMAFRDTCGQSYISEEQARNIGQLFMLASGK